MKRTIKSRTKKENIINIVCAIEEKEEAERLTLEIRKAIRKWDRLLKNGLEYKIEITFPDNDSLPKA